MTIHELHIKLEELGISKDKYYLHGLYGSTSDDDKFSLIIKKGTYSIEYETYYKERGEKHSIKTFMTEDEACRYLYKRLKEIQEIENKLSE